MERTILFFREQWTRDDDEDQIYCAFQKQKQKLLKRNGKEYQKLSEHVGRYPVVMISPADSALISEGSEDRRRFMNKIISQYNAEYLDSVLMYNKALQQRNRLLKDFRSAGNFDSDMLINLGLPAYKIRKLYFYGKRIFLLMSLFLFSRNTIH